MVWSEYQITLDCVLRKGNQSNWPEKQARIWVLCDAFCSHTALPRVKDMHQPRDSAVFSLKTKSHRKSFGGGNLGRLPPPMRAWLKQPHGRRQKAPPQPCALTTTIVITHIRDGDGASFVNTDGLRPRLNKQLSYRAPKWPLMVRLVQKEGLEPPRKLLF